MYHLVSRPPTNGPRNSPQPSEIFCPFLDFFRNDDESSFFDRSEKQGPLEEVKNIT